MSIKTGLYQGTQLKQEMKINPRLYQAMDLLYMPLLDLQQHIKQELLNNPFLDLEEPAVAEDEVALKDQQKEKEEKEKEEAKADEIDWEEILLDGFEAGGRRAEYEEKEYYEPVSVDTQDLYDHLRDQLVLMRLSERQMLLGDEIIGNIDENGYLTCSVDEVVDGLNAWLEDEGGAWAEDGRAPAPFAVSEGEEMLRILQGFDPPGIAARDLRECLMLQLEEQEKEDTLAYRIVREYFDQLINHRWSEISKDLSITPKDVQSAADEVAKLDPKPGLKHAGPADNYIIADLIVEKIDGEYLVFLNDTSLPRLKLSRAYREIARDKNKFKGENKEFISNKLNSANWMIQAIEQRRQTMLKVMNFIVDRQREFFEKGVQYLKPLTLREVAEVISMHESTVSRVTNEKYVQTPRGVLPLKFFFSSGLSTTSGEDVSARGIKAKIQKLVSEEEARRPLTDQAIVNILKEEGIQIARRTVAKYRDQLGILSARMRKRV
ncbi:MAG TPA: RNA polymerase factor sigma-54 [Longimicrobiales bacterium]|nr:RNA polymerase factor sigma-54 [Longimicrobiales bacterium]